MFLSHRLITKRKNCSDRVVSPNLQVKKNNNKTRRVDLFKRFTNRVLQEIISAFTHYGVNKRNFIFAEPTVFYDPLAYTVLIIYPASSTPLSYI